MQDTYSRQIDSESENTCGVSFAGSEDVSGRLWKTQRRTLRASELTPQIIARFQQKFTPSAEGCWLWKGTVIRCGYGQFFLRKEAGRVIKRYAHRVAYVLAYGDIDSRLDVMHACDNPPCVNPAHLSLGTHEQNMRDSSKRGRTGKTKPALRVISPEDVIAIRRNDRPAREWAEQCGVHVTHINKIRRGLRRKVA